MCKPVAVAMLLVALVALIAGCSRMTWDVQTVPEVHPDESMAAAETEPEVAGVADDFFGALAGDHLEDAYLLLTDEAQETLEYEQFESDLTWLGVKSHEVIAEVQQDDAAYVVARVEAAPASEDVEPLNTGFGLLLRRTEEGWRISFFTPQGEVYDAYPDLSLEEVGDGQFTLRYTDLEGASWTVTIVEF